MLLTLFFSVAVCYAIPLAQDAPPTVDFLLRAESSCMEMVKAQELLPSTGGYYTASFWPRTNTSPMFGEFDERFRKAGKNTYFMKDLGDARDDWSQRQSTLTETFNPKHDSQDSDQFLKQALNAMSTIVGIGAALSGDPVAGGVAAFIGGTVTAATTAMDQTAEENKGDLARVSDIAEIMAKYFNATMFAVNEELEHLVSKGEWHGHKLVDMFDNGAFADFRQLPLVDSEIVSVADRREIARKITTAITINTAWRQQRTWIMRYPMTKEEFDTKKTAAGDWDSRLRYYKDGHGYYLQSVWPEKSGAFYIPRYQNPPGWAEVWDKEKIPHGHVFESSIRSWTEAGFEGTINTDWTKFLPNGANNETAKKIVDDVTSYSGMFCIPICDLNMNNSGLKTVDAFLMSLNAPHNLPDKRLASFCFCLNLSDSVNSGKTFRDIVDVGNWEGGSNSWCNT
ncbi:hypothetical protein K458DRAFT_457327 [Lentithecium fluviatile CBS 122367]|uniref:Uncharacterized protein n=1 Tax=Lentithecium fluviatile CBS 122367 TaxID=1168545 RepID=A0A6G1IT50_9PLEO|nr:hypothetical protein K458DRAFT_457327 [Lentithecium fluviatile CBS 122367]